MTTLTPNKTEKRLPFSLLLNRDEYKTLSELSQELSISRGSVLRCAIRNLCHTKNTGSTKNAIPDADAFWRMFRGTARTER